MIFAPIDPSELSYAMPLILVEAAKIFVSIGLSELSYAMKVILVEAA
jgi:hypothetical protein